MSKELEVKHYKVLSLSPNLDKNAVYYLFDQNTGKVKTYITTNTGIPIPLIDLTTVGSVLSVTGTAVGGTSTNPKVDIATFVSTQLGNQVYLSTSDGKLQVNPITSPGNSLEVNSTSTELQLELSTAIQAQINTALQPGANISELTNDVGYLTLPDVAGLGVTNLTYTPSPTSGIVESSTGTDAIIPLAGVTNAGLLSPSEKTDIASAIQPSDLATVATTGDYEDLINIPTEFTPEAHTHPISDVINLQTSLDSKVDENTPIVGGTFTKISFDSKGLITNAVDATTADIDDSTNRRYVTDADLTDIENLSGINTGDQSSIVGITGTKSQFNTSLTDGDFLFVGDITQYTDELAQDAVGNILTDTATIDLSYSDGLNTISADVKPNSIDATHLSNAINVSEFINDVNYELVANKGISNGYASLDSGGKVPVSQLPNSVMEYKGVYDASTNTPTLIDGTGNTGDVYRVTIAGSGVNSLDFVVGDYVVYNGTTWEKQHSGADNVVSVFGRAGVVTAQTGDYTTGQVTEVTNKNYQTDNQKLFNDATSSIQTQLNSKQETLVSGTNIKTVNQLSLLGAGDINPSTSTKLISGCELINNGTTFTVNPGVYEIVSNLIPLVRTTINFLGVSNVTPLYPRTILYIDGTGTLQQLNGATGDLTPLQRRDNLFLGTLSVFGVTIVAPQFTPSVSYDDSGRFVDLSETIGVINRDGNLIGANGANLQFNKGAGHTFRVGSNYAVDRKVPDVTTDVALTPVPAGINVVAYRNGIGGWSYEAFTGSITPNFWDDGSGVKATVANNKFTIQRIYFFNGTDTFVIYLGQSEYSSMDEAVAAVNNADRVIDPATSLASLRSNLIVKKNTTALNNTADALFLEGSKFSGGASGSAVSSTNFQGVYLNSVTPQVTTTTTLGSVDFKRGSASDTDNVFRILNGAGTSTFSITGAGSLLATSYNGYTPANDSLVVHLAGVETITGQKSFTNYIDSSIGILFGNSAIVASSTLPSIGGKTNHFAFRSGNAGSFFGTFNTTGFTAQRDFVFPNASGTIALTSDLAAYAPITGGTGYIQNQNASAQSANMWISGEGRVGTLSIDSTSNIPVLVKSNASETYINIKSSGSDSNYGTLLRNTGNDFGIYHGNGVVNSLYINGSTGAATFTGSIFARGDNSIFTVDTGSSSRIGFTKKSGAAPYLTYGNTEPFVIAESSASGIEAANTFTPRVTIANGGAATFGSTVTASNGFVSDNATIASYSLHRNGVETARIDNFGNDFRINNFHATSKMTFSSNGEITFNTAGSSAFRVSTANVERLNISPTGAATFSNDVSLNGGTGARNLDIQTNTSGDPALRLIAAGSDAGVISYNRATSELTFSNSVTTGALKIGASGAATFASTVTASNSGGNYLRASNTVGGYAEIGVTSNASSTGYINFTNSLAINGGNVGIGVDSFPTSAKLSVISSSVNLLTISDNYSANNKTLNFTSTSGGIAINAKDWDNAATRNIFLANNGGNVGIGTASPASKLHVVSVSGAGNTLPTNASAIFEQAGNNLISVSGGLTDEAGMYMPRGTSAYYSGVFRSDTNLLFRNNDVERMRITSTGNLGIGTTSPTNKFQSYGGAITVGNESTYSARFSNNSDKGVIIGYDTTNNIGHIGSINPAVAWTNLSLLANGGNLLIGTATDDGVNKLQVNGSGKFSTNISNSNLILRGDSIEDYTSNSDAGVVAFNFKGYLGGTTKFRDFRVFNGKESSLLHIVGSTGVVKINNLSGTGTRMVTADASGNLATATIPSGGVNYQTYVCKLAQTGTSAPSETLVEDTITGTISWARISQGVYEGTLSGGTFSTTYSWVQVSGEDATITCAAYILDSTHVRYETHLGNTGSQVDGETVHMEIRDYSANFE